MTNNLLAETPRIIVKRPLVKSDIEKFNLLFIMFSREKWEDIVIRIGIADRNINISKRTGDIRKLVGIT